MAQSKSHLPAAALSEANIGWVNTIAPGTGDNLRTPGLQSTYDVLIVKGYHIPGDGGGGEFHWDANSTDPDDGGTIISNGASPGRWKRISACKVSSLVGASFAGPMFNVKWFGARGDGVFLNDATDKAAIQATIDACAASGGGTVFIPPGRYVCDDASGDGLHVRSNNISIVGAGTGASVLQKKASRGDVFTIGAVREVRFAKFGIGPVDLPTMPGRPDKTLVVSGACFHFNSGGIFNSIEDIHTHDMWDCIHTSHPRFTTHNLRVRDVTCEQHKRFGAWLIGAIDPAINNLWTFHASTAEGACVVYDSNCDGLILTGALSLHGKWGVRSQNSVAGGQGPRALNASKCIMDNAGNACWSLGSLSYGHFDGCFAATQQSDAMGVVIASDSADLHWANTRIANCWGLGVQINGAKSISFIGGSILGCNQSGKGFDAISIGLDTARSIKIKGMDIGQDPTRQLGGVPNSGVSLHRGVRFFQIEGNNFIACNDVFNNSLCPRREFVIANNLKVPLL